MCAYVGFCARHAGKDTGKYSRRSSPWGCRTSLAYTTQWVNARVGGWEPKTGAQPGSSLSRAGLVEGAVVPQIPPFSSSGPKDLQEGNQVKTDVKGVSVRWCRLMGGWNRRKGEGGEILFLAFWPGAQWTRALLAHIDEVFPQSNSCFTNLITWKCSLLWEAENEREAYIVYHRWLSPGRIRNLPPLVPLCL